MSVSVEKDELFRGELRKHPFWIKQDSKGCSNRGRMVEMDGYNVNAVGWWEHG